jgi:cell division transport system permease protein
MAVADHQAPGKSTGRAGASQSRAQVSHQLRGWLQHHRLSAAQSLLKVLERPAASMLTWLVIGIALALPVGFSVALDNVDRLGAGWDSPAQMSIFLTKDVDAQRAAAMTASLQQHDQIDSVNFVSREAALSEFAALSGFADVIESLQENPLPDVMLVTPRRDLASEAVAALRDELAALEDVDEVVVDMAWLQRLQSLLELSRRAVLMIGAMLVLGVILILGNTIRLAIEGRRDEIVVVKLVGGSNAFVRRPFLYTGLWYGVGGGLCAGLLVAAALWFVDEPVASLAALYKSNFSVVGPGVMGVLNLVILGGLLGLAGAWLAVTRHLSKIEPR